MWGFSRTYRHACFAALAGAALAGCIPPSGYASAASEPPPAPQRAPQQRPVRQSPVQQRAPQHRPPQQVPDYERRTLDQDVRALPAPPPAWEARRVVPDARQVPSSTYVVQPGETLGAIAAKTGAGAEAIARANAITSPGLIRAGQRLSIPGGRYHLVRAGESGIAIARAYSIAWSQVVAANALAEPYILRTGQRLLIPFTGPETLEQRAARFHIDIDDILTGGEPALAANAAPAKPTASSARILPPTTPVAAPVKRAAGLFAWPVSGKVVRRFGPGRSGERNDGIKIAVPLDTPVLAASDGVVAYVGSDVPALGGLVILKHGNRMTSVYGHAGQLLVQRGQAVRKGQTIARSGNSGFADRPELHFEIRQGRTPVDPLARLPAR
ncbi:M23 family metallopeptidase [Sphingomonas xinjiangensis]|uniref:Murein DD-endopeptidase MepM/ murein hydrolase activator NlpD n=1 Tax=Sphingomonas xinjiangensis TaxID=643568 RepID=A0A840YMX2_9SPHN|nr:M23 family metallopeptidase [Sphingomonas xinjiangensis]MBB5709001.1 murein DD-endopeptidase MepM/ murein hydrolase activator NlpD [Sphingomonas xinjiangensis]